LIDLPKNIHVIERGWLSANQIYIHDDSFVDIIDSGFCFHSEQTIQLFQSYLTQHPSILPRHLFNTHLHSDHCGGNRALQDAFHLKCLVPESEFASVNNWLIAKQSFDDLGQPCPKFTAHDFLKIGTTIQIGSIDFEIHGTPGHHPHSILFFAPSLGLLISADALWEKGFGALFSEVSHQTGFQEQRSTLQLIESLPVKVVVPGHGSPFTDIQSALDDAYSRLNYLESSPQRNTHHVAQVLFQFIVMFTETLTLEDGLNWCHKTPLFIKSADQLGLGVEELFSQTLEYLQNKKSLSFINGQIQYCW
jgi:glyoxylase-like metal-dependent hydrolase (beta-lactamase superfamily II)